jgi:hypothetical protein
MFAMENNNAMIQDNKEKYINPYTDFGFKKLFGTEMNKDLLISFLNALLEGSEKEIEDVQYLNSENLGDGYGDRRSVFDVYCLAKDGSRFIVEMQKAEQAFFKDRSVYYATTPIRQQAPKGEWDYRLDDVYTVGILNFEFPHGEYPSDSYRHEIKLKDVEDNHVFYDKLTFIYLEKLFEQAEIARYSESERRQYEESKKVFWDNYSVLKTAERKGEIRGVQKEKMDTIHRLEAMGLSVEQIAQGVDMNVEDVKKLLL